eukprot:scaffold115944_cov44-Prasinocladus_malaysianus.AAC.1
MRNNLRPPPGALATAFGVVIDCLPISQTENQRLRTQVDGAKLSEEPKGDPDLLVLEYFILWYKRKGGKRMKKEGRLSGQRLEITTRLAVCLPGPVGLLLLRSGLCRDERRPDAQLVAEHVVEKVHRADGRRDLEVVGDRSSVKCTNASRLVDLDEGIER